MTASGAALPRRVGRRRRRPSRIARSDRRRGRRGAGGRRGRDRRRGATRWPRRAAGSTARPARERRTLLLGQRRQEHRAVQPRTSGAGSTARTPGRAASSLSAPAPPGRRPRRRRSTASGRPSPRRAPPAAMRSRTGPAALRPGRSSARPGPGSAAPPATLRSANSSMPATTSSGIRCAGIRTICVCISRSGTRAKISETVEPSQHDPEPVGRQVGAERDQGVRLRRAPDAPAVSCGELGARLLLVPVAPSRRSRTPTGHDRAGRSSPGPELGRPHGGEQHGGHRRTARPRSARRGARRARARAAPERGRAAAAPGWSSRRISSATRTGLPSGSRSGRIEAERRSTAAGWRARAPGRQGSR